MTDPQLSNAVADGINLQTVEANGIRQRYAECGSGPLVLFCHGFPESWYSWRHQLRALGAAGYRCVAPDMRGYGGTDAPGDVEHYTILDLVGDMVALVRALGESNAVVVGHDWARRSLGIARCSAVTYSALLQASAFRSRHVALSTFCLRCGKSGSRRSTAHTSRSLALRKPNSSAMFDRRCGASTAPPVAKRTT